MSGLEPGDKIDYWTADGHQRTAYVDTHVGDQVQGEEKHTGVELTLRWDGTREAWVQQS